jgi:hypothetical protein
LQFPKEPTAQLIDGEILLHHRRSRYPAKGLLQRCFCDWSCIAAKSWSALTCQRFDKRRLVAARVTTALAGRDKSLPLKAVTSYRTPKGAFQPH